MTAGVDLNNPLGLWYGTTGVSEETSSASEEKDEVGRDEFLKLLVAQLQNQDPLSPVKNEEYIAQLATFSSLEQLIAIKQAVNQLAGIDESGQDAQQDNTQSTVEGEG